MVGGSSTGLARVTVASPRRRVDVALPENVLVAELLPAILRNAGEGLADEGQRHGGWVLRRTDGHAIDPSRTLGVQDVRDGEILHLVPGRSEWPELDYDDVVDAIATRARRGSRSWGSAATRRMGIGVAAGALLLGLVVLVTAGPPWWQPGLVGLGVALVLVVTAASVSRAMGDAGAGAVIGIIAMAYALVGGSVLLREDRPLLDLDAPSVLTAAAAVLIVSVLGYVGVADRTQYFVAGMVIGLLGIVGALLGRISYIDEVDAAAVLVTIAVAFTPAMPLLSIRLGKLPMPSLPRSTEELLADPPQVPPSRVHATVKRSDELLTGMLLGASVVTALGLVVLAGSGKTSAAILLAVVSAAVILRARLFPALRHRLPLLISGLVGWAALAMLLQSGDPVLRTLVGVPAIVVFAAAALAVGTYFQKNLPSPYLGRIADVLDILLVVSVVPIMCQVVGLYGYLRGIYG